MVLHEGVYFYIYVLYSRQKTIKKSECLQRYPIKEFATSLRLHCAYLQYLFMVNEYEYLFAAVLRIRIRMFLGLPDPDPFNQRYGPGSGSFYNQAKIVRKTFFCIYFFGGLEFVGHSFTYVARL